MSRTVRNLQYPVTTAIVEEAGKLRLDLLKIRQGSVFHIETPTALSTSTAVSTATALAIANAARSSLNAHMESACDASSGQGVHLAADSANPFTTPVATEIESTITLLVAEKAAFNAHRTQSGVHPANDAVNVVTAATPHSYDDLVALTNQEYTKYNTHLTQAGKHVANDATNTASSSASSNLATSLTRINDLATKYTAHLSQTDDADICLLVNDVHTQYEAHRVLTTGSVHLNADSTNADGSAVAATNLATAITRLNLVAAAFIAHCAQVGTGGSQVHLAADTVNNTFTATRPAVTRADCVALANQLKTKFLAHENSLIAHTIADGTDLVTAPVCVGHVHKVDDAADVLTATMPATTLEEGIALANDLRSKHNTHIASTTYHVAADATNPVTVAVATEYTTACTLANDLQTQVNAHYAASCASSSLNLVAP